jgi:hypothetical protein
MEAKGVVVIKHEFTATKIWPGKTFSFKEGWIDMEKIYKEALAGKMVTVMDISVDNKAYMVLGESKEYGEFIWTVEKEDTRDGSFLPLIRKYGTIMPAGLSAVEEFAYLAENLKNKTK